MRGSWCMTKPPEVRAELGNLGVSAAACERSVIADERVPVCGVLPVILRPSDPQLV